MIKAKLVLWFVVVFIVYVGGDSLSATKVNPTPESAPIFVIDIKPGVFVKNFRSTPMTLCSEKGNWSCLRASASGIFRAGFLESLKTLVRSRSLYIVDLRNEFHGFVNGIPVSWYGYRNGSNAGKSLSQIEDEETKLLHKLPKKGPFTINRIMEKKWGIIKVIDSFEMVTNQVETERQLAENYEIGYFRIPVVDRYKPTDEQVDMFLSFVKSLPENAWLHFHCRGGAGRSTTFFILYDIIRNGDKASLEEIIQRDCLIGPMNILNFPPKESWKREPAIERAQFIKDFYAYRKNPKGFGHVTWTEWEKGRQKK